MAAIVELRPLPLELKLVDADATSENPPATASASLPVDQAQLNLAIAEKALRTAEAELASIEARAAADRARYLTPPNNAAASDANSTSELQAAKELALAAGKSERVLAAARADEALSRTELALLQAAADKKAEAEKKLAMAKEAEKYGLTLEDIVTEEPSSEEPSSEEPSSEELEVTAPPRATTEREPARAIPDFTAGERATIQKQIDELKGATPKSLAERYREAGIEDAVPGQIERIREQMSGLDEERKRDRYLALAEAGFAGAAEAAKPGATFLGSIGVGATAGTRRLGEVNKEYRNLRSNLMGKIDEMERYRQGRLEGQIDRDIEFERESTKEMRRLQKDLASLNTELGKFQETAALTREGREAQQNPINMLQKQLIDAMESGDEARIKQLSETLAALTELSPSVIVARANERIAASKLAASGPRYMLPNAGQEDPELTSLLNKYGG